MAIPVGTKSDLSMDAMLLALCAGPTDITRSRCDSCGAGDGGVLGRGAREKGTRGVVDVVWTGGIQ